VLDHSMASQVIRVAVVYHSGYGHTAKQAEAVARGAASVPGTHVDLRNTPLRRSVRMLLGRRSTTAPTTRLIGLALGSI
jgi:hypothetical protein